MEPFSPGLRRILACGRRRLETRTETFMLLLILLVLLFSRRCWGWHGYYHPYYGYRYPPYQYPYGSYTPYDPYWRARYPYGYGYGYGYHRWWW